MLRGSGERLRHVGVAVGSIKGAEGRRGTVGRFGEGGKVWICVRSKHEAAEGVAVSQDHHGLHQLSQWPALLTRLQQRLEGDRDKSSGSWVALTANFNFLVFILVYLHPQFSIDVFLSVIICKNIESTWCYCGSAVCCFAVPGCVSRRWARVGGPALCWCGQGGEGEEVLPPNPATTEGPHPPSETGRSVDTPGSCSDVVQQPG